MVYNLAEQHEHLQITLDQIKLDVFTRNTQLLVQTSQVHCLCKNPPNEIKKVMLRCKAVVVSPLQHDLERECADLRYWLTLARASRNLARRWSSCHDLGGRRHRLLRFARLVCAGANANDSAAPRQSKQSRKRRHPRRRVRLQRRQTDRERMGWVGLLVWECHSATSWLRPSRTL